MSRDQIIKELNKRGYTLTSFCKEKDVNFLIASATINCRRNDRRTIEALKSVGIDIGRKPRQTVLDRSIDGRGK